MRGRAQGDSQANLTGNLPEWRHITTSPDRQAGGWPTARFRRPPRHTGLKEHLVVALSNDGNAASLGSVKLPATPWVLPVNLVVRLVRHSVDYALIFLWQTAGCGACFYVVALLFLARVPGGIL